MFLDVYQGLGFSGVIKFRWRAPGEDHCKD